MANRLWRWHFGRGIVPSMDNFGRLGEMPTNQPLLDWLALRFVEQEWSIKEMHRLIMLSSTYQMSSNYDAQRGGGGPGEHAALARQPAAPGSRRDPRCGHGGDRRNRSDRRAERMLTYKDRAVRRATRRSAAATITTCPRRAVYIPVVRSSMYEMFQAFDLPDPSTPNGDRNSTVVAPQALFMMNATLVLKSTRNMAKKLLARSDLDDAAPHPRGVGAGAGAGRRRRAKWTAR